MGQFSTSRALGATFRILRRRYGFFLLASLLYIALALAASCIPFGMFLLLPFMAGCIHAGVRDWRGEPIVFGDAFVGYRQRFLDLLVAGLLLGAAGMVAAIPAMFGAISLVFIPPAIDENAPPVVLALLVAFAVLSFALMFLLSLYIAARLTFAHPLVLDRSQPGFWGLEAVKESWALTRQCQWRILWFLIVTTVLGWLSVLLLGIGFLLIGLPLTFASIAGAYVELRGEPDRGSRQGA